MQVSVRRQSSANVLTTQRVRDRKDVKDTGFFYLSLAGVAIVALIFFVYLWSRVTVVHVGYDISQANYDRARLVEENKHLRLEQTRLSAPGRIEKYAREELGLDYPTPAQVVRIK